MARRHFTDIYPALILTNGVDDLLIAATFIEGQIIKGFLAFNIFEKFPNEIMPALLRITFYLGRVGGNIGR